MVIRSSTRSAAATGGPLGERLARQHRRLKDIACSYGLSNVRVFGSVARGEDRVDSDVDLLVDVGPRVGLLTLARCQRDLETLLGAPVDLVPSQDLKPEVAVSVLAEAWPL